MPRRFFRKFTFKRHALSKQWFMTPFSHLLHDHRLWGIQRRRIVPAFALGLFISFLPLPGHTLMAALAALALRINIPVAAVSTWASNPATVVPMCYLSYRIGSWLLGWELQPVSFELSLDWVQNTLVYIWQPMLLGSLLLGSLAALLGFISLDGLWRFSISRYKSRKRGQRVPPSG
jgi:uncharacterized protein (DUF2062 family)